VEQPGSFRQDQIFECRQDEFACRCTNVQLLGYQLIPYDTNIPQEPTVQANVDGMIADIEAFMGFLFSLNQWVMQVLFFEEEAKDLLTLGAHDTPLGNLVADAFSSLTSTDIAMQAGGSIALPLWKVHLLLVICSESMVMDLI